MVRVRYPRLGFAWGRKPAIAITGGRCKYETATVITSAGNHGWPYCMGNRQPYRDRSNTDATGQTGEPSIGGSPADTSVWYSWTAPTGGPTTVDTCDGDFDTGGYASWGPTVANRVPVHASGPYKVRHVRNRTRAIYTNDTPAGAFRGYGAAQAVWASERVTDLMAAELGVDPVELRRRNLLVDGDLFCTGETMHDVHFQELLDDAARAVDWQPGGDNRGKGVAVMLKGMQTPSRAEVGLRRVDEAGRVDQRQRACGAIDADDVAVELAEGRQQDKSEPADQDGEQHIGHFAGAGEGAASGLLRTIEGQVRVAQESPAVRRVEQHVAARPACVEKVERERTRLRVRDILPAGASGATLHRAHRIARPPVECLHQSGQRLHQERLAHPGSGTSAHRGSERFAD